MSSRSPWVVQVADLLRRPGETRDDVIEAPLDGLAVISSRVPDGEPVRLDGQLQSVNEGIVLKGTVEAPWTGECRRCLRPVTGRLSVDVLEVFEDEPTEGETSKLDGVQIDLEPLVREAVLLDLPLAPLCREDCAGLCVECGALRDEVDCGHGVGDVDPRWGALEELRFDD
jgi:uncharacterized protein